MKIDTEHTIAAAEALLNELDGARTDTTLRLATNSHGHLGGGEAAVVQALITWAQAQNVATIETFAANAEDPQLITLVRHLVGLTAALLSDEITARDRSSVYLDGLKAAESRYEGLQRSGGGQSRGRQFEIICADHQSLELPPLLYDTSSATPKLRSETAFRELGHLIASTNLLKEDGNSRELISAIGDALYELFKNTEDHAKLDIKGNFLSRSVRGMHGRRHERSPDELEQAFQATPRLLPFARRLQPLPGRKKVQFVEFSVFDSGPGFASQWRKEAANKISQDHELEAIAKCFSHRSTTKATSGRGIGLPIVIAALRDRGGVLRVRTGRQSLFADFAGEADVPFDTPPAFLPFSERQKMALASGTLITFMLPLGSIE